MEKYNVGIMSKTSLSARTAKVMSDPASLKCLWVKVVLYLKMTCSFKNLI